MGSPIAGEPTAAGSWAAIPSGATGQPRLAYGGNGDAFLSLTFYDNVSFEDAKKLAVEMWDKFKSISYTKFTT